ncbi:DUF3311 domain-containing protein [Listeria fleischmannii]|jgi:uncharacterized membrane protein|uniref:DUF3311 domain-containing protein n=1 Tax=Listeria fleischmannii TaxID=1069827 RepID=A0A841YGA1_9LIST|nr:DUF3311 domain-containing protein [Listeria fleischmannii]EIA18783.1 hypothetical protein KKC_16012 [Listeria fleischmannii subsp. coloradonensis]MBC1399482.1 DUF3311 domain-containing protein [Listeria fleischmannii]MBC1427789.1 DUF3311 domain-containing protein [Listeria fleischmannii]STY46686.1 Protein of uncharacterised function (DUF3311) [Listeria fleischmannii subsp. coloradonensis]
MKKWLLIIPFLFILGGIPFANRVYPLIFGIPFVLAYIASGIILSSIILFLLYKWEQKGEDNVS